MAEGQGDGDTQDSTSRPDLSKLAEAWDNNKKVRRACMEHGQLLSWPDPTRVGVISLPALSRNFDVVMELLKIYLPQVPSGKTAYVDDLKEQVGLLIMFMNCLCVFHVCGYCNTVGFLSLDQVAKLREDLRLKEDAALVHCEGMALRSFVTLVNRRNDACLRKETCPASC